MNIKCSDITITLTYHIVDKADGSKVPDFGD